MKTPSSSTPSLRSAATPPAAPPAPTGNLKILKVSVHAFKGIVAAEAELDPNFNEVTGENGAGKTSFCQAIRSLLEGGKALGDKPVRAGNKKAVVEFTLGRQRKTEYVATMTVNPSGPTYKITHADGSPVEGKTARAFLDELKGERSMDPLGLLTMPPRELSAMLFRVTGLDAKLAEIEARKRAVLDAKRDATRDVQQASAQLVGLPDRDGPDEEQSAADVVAEIEEAQAIKEHKADAKWWLANKEAEASKLLMREQEITGAIQKLTGELAEVVEAKTTILKETTEAAPQIDAMPDPDTTQLKEKLSSIEQLNAIARHRRLRSEVLVKQEIAKKTETAAARALEAIDGEKNTLLINAQLPVDGMKFDETGVTINGIPVAEVNTTSRILAGVHICKALNKDAPMQFIQIEHGALIDTANRQVLREVCIAEDLQLLVEVATDGEERGITISHGEVVAGGAQ